MTFDIQNCPFCGSDDVRFRSIYIEVDCESIYFMECMQCLAKGPEFSVLEDKKLAAEAWNRRIYSCNYVA